MSSVVFAEETWENLFVDNPFLPGGELSEDAIEIVNALKAGKLSAIGNSESEGERIEKVNDDDLKGKEKFEPLVKPLDRKYGVIDVKKIESKSEIQIKNKRHVCCILL